MFNEAAKEFQDALGKAARVAGYRMTVDLNRRIYKFMDSPAVKRALGEWLGPHLQGWEKSMNAEVSGRQVEDHLRFQMETSGYVEENPDAEDMPEPPTASDFDISFDFSTHIADIGLQDGSIAVTLKVEVDSAWIDHY